MATVAHYLEIQAPADRCYQWWRPLTHLPQIMPDVKSVEPKDGSATETHWVVSGPLGKDVEWDARIIDEEVDRKIAWTSIEGSNNTVETGGAVRFDDHGASTGVEVSLHVDTPAGALGDVVAKLFADPQKKVEEALDAFKKLMEAQPPSAAV
ncbi:SRPBCC family protein [Actinomycetospora chiangmaiensis]|uniref:SRPBCC family protein n=1 Tax=Actinomycetospora chiangmaiensis TaxID=402650 RepID=UPI00039B0F6B|nr:SRPBCC family protein [Actinomycetospora chiangmaiensis]